MKFSPLPIAIQSHGGSGRHGGDGRFSRHRFAGVRAQGAGARLPRGKSLLGGRTSTGASDDPRYFQISAPVQPDNSGGALAATGALPENVNYAVKSREGRHVAVPNFRDADTASLPILESVPNMDAKLKSPKSLQTATPKFEDVVKSSFLFIEVWSSGFSRSA